MRQVINRNLSSKVRENLRSGKQITAIVVESYFDKVTVQLAGNGQLMRNLAIIGGPVDVGDAVEVDFGTTPPQVLAQGKTFLTADDLENALSRLGDSTNRTEADISIVLFSGGASLDMYDASSDGLNSALEAANEGDVIWLPDIDIILDCDVKDGVTLCGISSRQSIIQGTVTLGENSTLENLKVVKTERSDNTLRAVICNAVEEAAHIINCEIHCYSCEFGIAYGIEVDDDGLLVVEKSTVFADTGGATAYAFKCGSSGEVELNFNKLYGKTQWYDISTTTIEEYDNKEATASDINVWCVIPSFENQFASHAVAATASDVYLEREPVAFASTVSVSLSSGNERFARFGNEVYRQISDSGGFARWKETNVITETSVDLPVYSTTADYGNPMFCVVDLNKILVSIGYTSGSDFKIRLYLADFVDETSLLYYEFDAVDDLGGGSWREFGVPDAVNTVHNEDGDLIVVFSGPVLQWNPALVAYSELGGSGYEFEGGRYFLAKNWTQDGAWNRVYEFANDIQIFHDDFSPLPDQGESAIYFHNTSDVYSALPVVGNRYINMIYRIPQVGIVVDDNTFPNYLIGFSFDVQNFSLSYVVEFISDIHEGIPGSQSVSSLMAVDNENEVVVSISSDSTDYSVWTFDPVALNFAYLYDITAPSGRLALLSSKVSAYYLTADSTTWNLYQVIGNSAVFTGKTLPNYQQGGFCMSIDDNDRIWMLYKTSGKLTGHLLSNFNNKLESTTSHTNTTILWDLHQVGDGFILVSITSGRPAQFLRDDV